MKEGRETRKEIFLNEGEKIYLKNQIAYQWQLLGLKKKIN